MSEPRLNDKTLVRLRTAHDSVKVTGPGMWDGVNLIDLIDDLIDARTRIAELERELASMKSVIEFHLAGGGSPDD